MPGNREKIVSTESIEEFLEGAGILQASRPAPTFHMRSSQVPEFDILPSMTTKDVIRCLTILIRKGLREIGLPPIMRKATAALKNRNMRKALRDAQKNPLPVPPEETLTGEEKLKRVWGMLFIAISGDIWCEEGGRSGVVTPEREDAIMDLFETLTAGNPAFDTSDEVHDRLYFAMLPFLLPVRTEGAEMTEEFIEEVLPVVGSAHEGQARHAWEKYSTRVASFYANGTED